MRYKLMIDLPLLKKGRVFEFDSDTGFVYGVEFTKDNPNGQRCEYPLRTGLAGYLCLLRGEKGLFRRLQGEAK